MTVGYYQEIRFSSVLTVMVLPFSPMHISLFPKMDMQCPQILHLLNQFQLNECISGERNHPWRGKG